jgi:hypothetical protein
LLAAWEAEHGAGSVKGLAPSAAAAANLGDELGIATENTAKWLAEVDREASRLAEAGRLRARAGPLPAPAGQEVLVRAAELEAEVRQWQLGPGDLLLVDEASLAGTFALDRLAAQARGSGAKILLIGDWAQLGAVGAGGAFSMLVDDRETPPELSEARRFVDAWERRASAELRAGSPAAVDAYLGHGRVVEGNREDMLAACYGAWKADVEAGKSSLMLAVDNATVAELNRLARAERVAAGMVADDGLALSDGSVAGVGDVVVARCNDRHLRLADGEWVRNRDRFVVTATHQDGAMTVRAIDRDGEVLLPAGYVAEHVELGYAGTVFSAQGRTVATAHALVGVGMTREALYVAATRAREANRLYVDVEPEPAGAEMAHGQAERLSAREVLVAVASRRGADLSAHQTMASEWARAESFDQLVREHQSLVAAAMAQRWESALDAAGLSGDMLAQARRSPEWAGLLSALRDANDRGLDVNSALSELARLDGPGRGPRRRAPGAPAALGEAGRWPVAPPPGPGGRPGPSSLGDRRPRPRPSRRRARRRHHQARPGPGRACRARWRGLGQTVRPAPPEPGRRRGLVGPRRCRRRLPGPLAYQYPEHPGRAERHRLALPSRPPRPGATGRAGGCSLGRLGAADRNPGRWWRKPTARGRGRPMSRAARRYRKWERGAREAAWQDGRSLTLDLYHGRAGPLGPYEIGLVLEPGEVILPPSLGALLGSRYDDGAG